jgi:hypothetical protein
VSGILLIIISILVSLCNNHLSYNIVIMLINYCFFSMVDGLPILSSAAHFHLSVFMCPHFRFLKQEVPRLRAHIKKSRVQYRHLSAEF